MKKFIFYLFLLISFNFIYLNASSGPTSLIIVRGTANSGKSTLCKTFNNLSNNSYQIVSQDDLHRKSSYKIFKVLFPIEMKQINQEIAYENRWQAIKYGNIIFPKNIEKEKEQFITDAINKIKYFFDDPQHTKQSKAISALAKQKVMHQLLFHATQRHNVIFDAWGVTNWDYEINELKNYFDHLIGVVTYCSLKTVKQRWKHRNQCAIQTNNYTEMRLMTQMLRSFFGFLQPKDSEMVQSDFLSITKTDFDILIQKALLYINNRESDTQKQREFTAEELLDFKNKMYIKFRFDINEKIVIVPSISYDILLCTEGSCDDYASELLQKIHNFSQSKI